MQAKYFAIMEPNSLIVFTTLPGTGKRTVRMIVYVGDTGVL